ncbi:MAG: UPF0175 family protein [Chloroflexi bacterium]|nr:UPF0175 family protein [Chloroflexota bacterium]
MIIQSAPTTALWPLDLSAILRLGFRQTPDEVLAEAMRYFLAAHPEMRAEVAIEMYHYDYVTLSRAAEIAEMNRWAFQSLLKERGLTILNPVDAPHRLDEALNCFLKCI